MVYIRRLSTYPTLSSNSKKFSCRIGKRSRKFERKNKRVKKKCSKKRWNWEETARISNLAWKVIKKTEWLVLPWQSLGEKNDTKSKSNFWKGNIWSWMATSKKSAPWIKTTTYLKQQENWQYYSPEKQRDKSDRGKWTKNKIKKPNPRNIKN